MSVVITIPSKYAQVVDKDGVTEIKGDYIVCNRVGSKKPPEVHITLPDQVRNSKGTQMVLTVATNGIYNRNRCCRHRHGLFVWHIRRRDVRQGSGEDIHHTDRPSVP